jgi:hypothetical protein
MKKEDIDKLIEESLSKEEAEFYHQLDEPGLMEQWAGLYKTRLGGWAILVTSIQVIFTIVTFWLAYQFFTAESVESQIRWGGGMFIGFIIMAQLKLWHWMQMDKNTILQQMKRIEYQIAVLTEKINEKK